MTPQQLLGLGLRLSSIWMALMGMQLCFITGVVFDYFRAPHATLWNVLPLLPVALSVPLWIFPMLIAHRLLPQRDTLDAIGDTTSALAVILGFFAIFNAFPHLYSGMCMVSVGDDFTWTHYLESSLGTTFIPSLIQCALGLLLILMPRPITALVFCPRAPAMAAPARPPR